MASKRILKELKDLQKDPPTSCSAGKFPKSKGIEVFGNDVKDTNIPVEVW